MANIFSRFWKPKRLRGESSNDFYSNFSIPLNWSQQSALIRSLEPSELMTYGIIVRAIQLIANDIGKVNFRHVKENKGQKQFINSEIVQILNQKPNPYLTPWEFRKIIIWNLFLYGYCPLFIQKDEKNNPSAIIPIFPPFIARDEKNGGYIFSDDKDKPIKIDDSVIIWIDYEIIPGFERITLSTLFKSTLTKIKENELSTLNAIKNDISYSVYIKIRDATSKEQRQQAEKALREMIEKQKRDGSFAIVLDERWEFGKASEIINMRPDFQTRNALGREFAAVLGIPPQKLGIDDPNKYNSSAELNKSYVDNSLKPLLLNICQRLSYSLLEPTREYITYKQLDLLSVDIKSIQEFASSAINNGYATPNEIRNLIGLDAHPDGDKLLINSTLVEINQPNPPKGETNANKPKPAKRQQ
ncbi:phage portal protein [[Mycoplasma] gypis]|uniref:Phage portal protein n=1 Tax=[Mycoplasma] gypis TaxID=92404 RepID=A0ABZ2RV08_9BACT|nr:phage portal protein [[Mycoplasma] gypis]MBN0919426.1 phage portal protein [[Mycoplasma] gypis]